MECSTSTACPNSKRKAAEAELDDDVLSDGGNADVAVDAAAPAPAAAAAEDEGAQGEADEEAPRQPKRTMSQEWIDSILNDEMKPLPLNERLLRKPELAAVFHSHEQSRARFADQSRAAQGFEPQQRYRM